MGIPSLRQCKTDTLPTWSERKIETEQLAPLYTTDQYHWCNEDVQYFVKQRLEARQSVTFAGIVKDICVHNNVQSLTDLRIKQPWHVPALLNVSQREGKLQSMLMCYTTGRPFGTIRDFS